MPSVKINDAEIQPCLSVDCVDGYFYDEDSNIVQLTAITCHQLGSDECPDIVFERR